MSKIIIGMNQSKNFAFVVFLTIPILLFWTSCYAEHDDTVSTRFAQFLNHSELSLSPPLRQLWKKTIPDELKDAKHGIVMGVSSEKCDNGKVNLTIDWDGSPVNHTCFTSKYPLPVKEDIEPYITCDKLPPGNYSPTHYCMDTVVQYNSSIPTYEGHRPLWPIFGEYQFVPPQRWLHNVEHGAIIMLYHPCAEPSEILKLKKLVKSCLWKYVITPWNMLSREMPFALVAWGCRLQMAKVDSGIARYFIRSKAFRGPESHYLKQGQFSVGLIEASNPPSDTNLDKVLC
ncbi:uncharacterized protein LOC124327531 [Daphnia pulicaria]|uniref:uncharacterized protein LOC124327531 n=1 Tax=Daphnia pulicaria TaxID=35523 RepID=UPI001EEA47A8|nr:uncharacterized protein LOC124327531 [Daphnia pulicaria]